MIETNNDWLLCAGPAIQAEPSNSLDFFAPLFLLRKKVENKQREKNIHNKLKPNSTKRSEGTKNHIQLKLIHAIQHVPAIYGGAMETNNFLVIYGLLENEYNTHLHSAPFYSLNIPIQ